MANNIKTNLTSKQIGEDKMLVSTVVDGVTVYMMTQGSKGKIEILKAENNG